MKSQNFNLFAAVIVVIAFVFFWDAFVVSKYGPPKKPAQTVASQPAPETQIAAPNAIPIQEKVVQNQTPVILKVLEDERNIITFETKGARITSWQMKEKNHWVELVGATQIGGQLPLESFGSTNFAIDSVGARQIVFSGLLPEGIKVKKTLTLSEASFMHQLRFSFENSSKQEISINDSLTWSGGLFKKSEGVKNKNDGRAEIRALGLVDRVRSWKPGAFFGKVKNESMPGPFRWVGVDNEHFLAAFIPENGTVPSTQVFFDKVLPPSIFIPISQKIGPKETKILDFKLFVGPKQLDMLEKVDFDLKLAVDYGFLEKILLASLQFVNRFTHNYGWAIIVLTIFVQLLMYPLTKKSLQSSLKMKTIQPQIKKIQEMYKGDTQRLHIETMNLYKKHGMKFMGMEGCLPLIIQMPIFFAIFKMLRSAYDLRGAPWMFWIKDLSAADSTFVLPILMGLGMFIQQKTTTVSVDPAQAKMMYIFPIMLTFMFASMPSGLVIYWIVQSAATIVIQKLLMMKLETPVLQK